MNVVHRVTLALVGLALSSVTACAHVDRPGSLRDLSMARPVKPAAAWKVRVPTDARMQKPAARTLCTEFQLVEMYDQESFEAFCRQIGLTPPNPMPDLRSGALVGVLAHVGEQMSDAWPLAIETVRLRDGAAWIKVRFQPGAYYPINTAAYCELVYVAGLRNVLAVEINRRTFLAQ